MSVLRTRCLSGRRLWCATTLGRLSDTSIQHHQPAYYSTSDSTSFNYYDTLELNPKSTQRQVKSAYYRLSKIYHPDANKATSNQQKFSQISEAYKVLGNIQERRLYDQGLQGTRRVRHATNPFQQSDFSQRRKRKGPPPTGKTQIYNFDEFYRQHYGASLERKRMYNKAREEMTNTEEREQERHKAMVWGYVFCTICATVAYLIQHNQEK